MDNQQGLTVRRFLKIGDFLSLASVFARVQSNTSYESELSPQAQYKPDTDTESGHTGGGEECGKGEKVCLVEACSCYQTPSNGLYG